MKTKNLEVEKSSKNEFKGDKSEAIYNSICGRSYNEEVPFSQINFNTYQNILDKRNELLGTVKANKLD